MATGDAVLPATQLRLRPTMLSDLDFVLTVEQDRACRPYITPWERTQHEGAVRFPDFRHFIVEAGAGTQAVGFVILQGCRSRHRSVEIKRIVIQVQVQGQGLGRACLQQLKRMAFRDLPTSCTSAASRSGRFRSSSAKASSRSTSTTSRLE